MEPVEIAVLPVHRPPPRVRDAEYSMPSLAEKGCDRANGGVKVWYTHQRHVGYNEVKRLGPIQRKLLNRRNAVLDARVGEVASCNGDTPRARVNGDNLLGASREPLGHSPDTASDIQNSSCDWSREFEQHWQHHGTEAEIEAIVDLLAPFSSERIPLHGDLV